MFLNDILVPSHSSVKYSANSCIIRDCLVEHGVINTPLKYDLIHLGAAFLGHTVFAPGATPVPETVTTF